MPDARVDVELVRRGLARSRRHAAELVAAGRVRVAGTPVAKPSLGVASGAVLDVAVDSADPNYASRAGGKLAGALDALTADPVGRRFAAALDGAWCLDLGASTGGFTDVLLRRGAAHVVALDVGHGQLVEHLRADPRVTVVEGYNVRDLKPADLARAPDVVVGDLSFISLTLVLPAVADVLPVGAPALLLVKPQFEVGRERLGSGGVVRDPAQHADAVLTVARAGGQTGLDFRAVVPSPLPGPSGNREYFCWFERVSGAVQPAEASLVAAVERAVAWQPAEPGRPPSTPPVVLVPSAGGGAPDPMTATDPKPGGAP